MRDKVLTPRNYEGIEFLNYFVKAEWSLVKLKDGPTRIPRCVLATLTSTFQLVVYGQTGQVVEENRHGWATLINVSKTANEILQKKWESEASEETQGLRFEEYKKRVKELTCVDFAWIPRFEDEENMETDTELFLVVAHANGTITIWWIFRCLEAGQLIGEIINTTSVFEGEIISAMKVHRLNNNIGMLAIGTNGGAVKIFLLELKNQESMEIEEGGKQKPYYILKQEIEIWSKDSLRIESFSCSMLPPEERNILKRITVDILFLKHPFHLCSCSVSVFPDGLVWEPVENIKIPEGPIVGLDRYSNELYMICNEFGILSLVYHKDGVLKYIDGSANSIKDGNDSRTNVYGYNGFALSPNKGLAFVGKNFNCFYDHNMEKDPAKLLVFSLLPMDGTWENVKEIYVANRSSLQQIPDVLLAFRHQIRTVKDLDIEQYLDTPGDIEMSPDILRLYLWTLRAMYLPGDDEAREDFQLLKRIADVYQRQLEVEDEILQRHYISLLESIDETTLPKLTLPEAQSLYLIQQFLNSKPNLHYLSFEPAIIPTELPKCLICSNTYEFKDEDPLALSGNANTTSEETIPPPHVVGFEWSKQQCTRKHVLPVCILTLLPCDVPYRTCETCGVICMLNPLFGQKPHCPLCGDVMLFSDTLLEDEETQDAEDSDPENAPGIRFLGVKAEAVFL